MKTNTTILCLHRFFSTIAKRHALASAAAALLMLMALMAAPVSHAEITVTIAHNASDKATPDFKFKNIPSPAVNDAASKAAFTIIDGARNPKGGNVDKLHDGKMPVVNDQRPENFSFNDGTKRGRLLVDLGAAIEIKQVNTYSWHPGPRARQVYTLYASDGAAPGFDPRPKNGIDPETRGWKRIAQVDTRAEPGKGGTQHGVSISDTGGSIGRHRYLLFEILPASQTDAAIQTFFSEIDVIDTRTPVQFVHYTIPKGAREVFKTDDGVYSFTIDTTQAPEMTEWVHAEVLPVIKEWYPRLVRILPNKGPEAPKNIVFVYKKIQKAGVPAYASGRVITLNAHMGAKPGGAVVHEMVHVVQRYGQGPKTNPNAVYPPGWLVEGIADYVRFYLYDSQNDAAYIGPKRASKVNYNGSYRTSANFLHWASQKYDKNLVTKIHIECSLRNYTEGLWKKLTGRTLQELNAEWKADLAKQPPR